MKKTLLFLLALCAVARPALAEPFTFPASQMSIVVAPPVDHEPIRVPINAADGFNYSAMQVQSDASWVTPTVDAAAHQIVLKFTTGALVNRSNTATITATQGADSQSFFVKAAVSPLNVVKLIDDPFRSRVYGIHQNDLAAGAVIIYDPINAKLVGSITVGRKPTDLAVSNDGKELFVINHVDRSISVIDLVKLATKEVIPLAAFDQWSPDDYGLRATSAHIKTGPGNIIYYTDANWAPSLRVFDRATHKVLQTIGIDENGFGDFALTSDYKQLVGWAQYGWTAGWAGSYVARFTVAANGTVTKAEATDANYPTQLMRDPLDTPVLIANDNSLAFVKELAVKPSAIRQTQQKFPTAIYSITPGGEVAATHDAVFETDTGNKLLTLPVTTTVQTITSDYARLVYYNTANRAFGTIDLLAKIGDRILNRALSPAEGAIVLAPDALHWQSVPGANVYRVYLGIDKAAVTAATKSSPLFLGEATSPMFALAQKLAPGVTYFWRVDTVTSFEVSTGAIHSFTVSEISASLSKISTATVQGHAAHIVSVNLAASTTKTWTASSTTPWISFVKKSGTTPGTLQLVMNASHLAPGVYNGSVAVSGSSGGPFAIPVKLRVDRLAITILKSDRGSATVYAISEDLATAGSGAYLIEADASTETIRRVLPVGASVTDLAVHDADNRIYIPNWEGGLLRAVDKTTFQQVRTYAFSPFGGVGYSDGDVYRVTPGAKGRLLIEEADQWIDISLFNTVNGATVAKAFAREGGGASDETGRFYYHGDNNSSGSELHKYELTGDKFTELKHVTANQGLSGYGSRVVLASEDGTRVFWNGMVFNQDLAPIRSFPQEIYSTTATGRYAFGETDIYDTSSGLVVGGMPATTKVSAFNPNAAKLAAQVGASIRFFPVQIPLVLPAPSITMQANGGGLLVSWTDASLETGFTLQRRAAGTTDWQDVAVTIGRNTTSVLLSGLEVGTTYEFRIKADTPTASSAWSPVVTITMPAPERPAILGNISTRMTVAPGDEAMIAGFIINGSTPKKVIIRGLGPQLGESGLSGLLADPTLELHRPDGSFVFNDNWKDSQQSVIEQTMVDPHYDAESAIVATLNPGSYTAVLRGKNSGTGLGLVEVYDLQTTKATMIANLSTRGFVSQGDNVLIGGLILVGNHPADVILRAIGPSLASAGVSAALQDPVLELYDAQGNVTVNDNWRTTQQSEIIATGVPPQFDEEAAIRTTLAPGNYTAVVRGKNGATGVALIEAYNLQ